MSITKKKTTQKNCFSVFNLISIKCVINANSEVTMVNLTILKRRSCETADILQLSTPRYRSWIVNSTVCSVLACAWVCVATLRFLVWNRCLPYRWSQCFHNPFDVLDYSRHADSKRNSCFPGALWSCDRAFFPFFRCIMHRILCTATGHNLFWSPHYLHLLRTCLKSNSYTETILLCCLFFRYRHFSLDFVIFMYFVLF